MSDAIDTSMVWPCQEYARLRCLEREADRAGYSERGTRFHKAADAIYRMTPHAADYLDTIKKIMEIDTDVTDPNVVLMRASVIT